MFHGAKASQYVQIDLAPGVNIASDDFTIAFCLLILMMVYYKVTPTWAIVLLPLFVILALLSALAVSLWFSALNVLYRDVQHSVPFIVQVWMFASPVAYSATVVPSGKWSVIYGLNPMVGVIQGFRWALFGGDPPGGLMLLSVGMVFVLLVGGLFFFKRLERIFADVV